MKRIAILAATGLLAACGEPATEEAVVAEEQVVEAEPALVHAGSYEGTNAEGEAWSSVLASDGTYQDMMGGEVTESGTWTEAGERVCFTPIEGEAVADGEYCYTAGEMAPDGTMDVTNEVGETMTVTKIT